MMEEPLSRGASPSGDSNLSIGAETIGTAQIVTLDDRLLDLTSKTSLGVLRTPPTKKAKRVRFFRNGDKFYTGVVMAVTPERYRSFDSLASDLTRALISSVTLPNGVRSIYTMDGRKVQSVSDLEDGKCYVVSGQGELFKKVEYSASKVRRGSSLSGLPQLPSGTGRPIGTIPSCVKAKIVTLIRNGSKPRKVVRLLLNKRNAPTFEHVYEAITEAVKLDSGAVRRVYTLGGKPVIALEQFFESEEVFIAYGTEKSTQEDFELDAEESKYVQSFRRGPWVSKRQSGPMPVMPRKSGKRTLTAPQVRTPSPSSLILPQPLRLHYAVGHVIGDGNFAVVRHCIHKTTGAEYAMKIVDKYKCQGKETMLASEVAILRQVCHPNIISLISEQETVDQLFLVMELVKGGDLFDAIAAATKFSEAEASVMIGHLTSALAYLHSHHIVHRDVKPENLLVEMEGSQVRCLKLGDFGLAQFVREPLYTVCGTPTYVAPEILAESGYGLKIDVWAAGVILYILLCGFPPFVSPENDQEELFERILSGQYEFTSPYWDPVSDSAKQLIINMLQAQPELRFSAEDVLDHPWLVQRFLGGNQTPASAGTAVKSSQQHRDQQCQPLRLATFEFDYKKQRRVEAVSCDRKINDGNEMETSVDVRNKWFDASVSVNEAFRRSVAVESRERDETDNANGNRNNGDNEPLSLSADCLQDIRDLTTSMHDLMNNIENRRDNDVEKTTKISANSGGAVRKSSASSTSSLSERCKSSRRNDNDEERRRNAAQRCESPISSNKHSVNTRNGNSLSDIHSTLATTPRREDFNNRRQETPKTGKFNDADRTIRPKRTNLSKAPGFGRNGSNDSNDRDRRYVGNSSIERLSHSTDGLSGSSDNNIETSDSFVNIQFANKARTGRDSSSTQSVESSDSFENTRFIRNSDNKKLSRRNSEKKNEDVGTSGNATSTVNSRKNDGAEKQQQHNSHKRSIGPGGNREIRPPVDYTALKSLRPSLIPVQNNGQTRNTTKSLESSRIPQNDTVKLRDKKNIAVTNNQSKNDTRNKRFSCLPQYSSKFVAENNETIGKTNRSVIGNGRKCSSTDELREEQQKPSTAKTKRFSLYYTPQPSRKNYETENRSGRNSVSKTPGNSSSRPTSWKTPEMGKRLNEDVPVTSDRRDSTKNRKSVVESTTAASRSKSNRQSIHIRANPTTNTNLPAGRTK